MIALLWLMPLSLLLLAVAVRIFFWAVKHNQFMDLDRQALSVLDDDVPTSDKEQNT